MTKIRGLLSLLPFLVLWLFLSVFLWGWIFTFLTDAPQEKKITVFVDEREGRFTELAAALEEALPEPLRMVKVHPFSYAMLDGDQLRQADLFIVRASNVEEYHCWFLASSEADEGLNGIALDGAAGEYIDYSEECYLFFGALSRHVAENSGAVDDAARVIAEKLLSLKP